MPVKMPIKSYEPWNDGSLYEPIDLDDDMEWKYTLLDLPTTEFLTGNDVEHVCFSQIELQQQQSQHQQPEKYTIRNHDCMWSGRCVAHQEKTKCQTSTQNKHYQQQTNNLKQQQQIQQIPAGRSLLLNSRTYQPKSLCNKLPTISTQDFLKDREVIVRPDTPISLDDDPPEFKHTIDLAACTMGSNQISLINNNNRNNNDQTKSDQEEDPSKIINLLKAHLEDTSTDNPNMKNDLRPFLTTHKAVSLTDFMNEMKYLSDFEELEDDDDDSTVEMDSDSESGSSNISTTKMGANKMIQQYQATHVADHSYTRPKNRVDILALGVQTPSDSEEEIDVVSVGDKTLPTNPTARDRRALQTTVADKITARMVTTPRGIKTLPPRRRCSDDDSNSESCNSTPTKMNNVSNNNNSNYISSTNLNSQNYTMQCNGDFITDNNINNTNTNSNSNNNSSSTRKRSQQSNKDTTNTNNTKRHRGKKQRSTHQHATISASLSSSLSSSSSSSSSQSSSKRQHSDSDEADTIEKRNLHNDMERQRRIGLKNLFEELKRQIPSIRDKERAPKVSILREAATLCNKLNRDQEQLAALKKQQQRLLQRVKSLRTTMAPKWG